MALMKRSRVHRPAATSNTGREYGGGPPAVPGAPAGSGSRLSAERPAPPMPVVLLLLLLLLLAGLARSSFVPPHWPLTRASSNTL